MGSAYAIELRLCYNSPRGRNGFRTSFGLCSGFAMTEKPATHIRDLAIGLQLQRAGRLADAARCYRSILAGQPDNADALHLLGVLLYQNGKFDKAARMIARAVAVRPGDAAYHANLALAYRARGELQRSVDCCRTALRLRPDYHEAANNLGLVLHDMGRFADAVAQFDAARKMRPGLAVVENNRGMSLFELGRTSDAMSAYRAAIGLDPALAPARVNLGRLLLDQGQPHEGLTHCLEAARLGPGAGATLILLGNAYRALYRWSEAHAAYDRAQALASRAPVSKGELAQVGANRGLALFLEGKRGEAFAAFRRAVDLAPKDAAIWRFLADAYDVGEQHAAAGAVWEKIIELTPGHAGAHSALGWSFQQQGRFAEAGDCYRRALELDPRLFAALLNRGSLHEELGELAEAEAVYRQARVLWPDAPNPLARLAQLLRGKLPGADRDAIEAQLAGPAAQCLVSAGGAIPPGAPAAAAAPAPLPAGSSGRGPLLFGMAQVLDARGSYARAAECLAEANALAREKRRSEGRHYDPAPHSAMIDQLIAGFTPRLFNRLKGAGDDTRLPVFVFGMPRAGTTLVEQILASHSRVHGAGELRLATEVFDSIPRVPGLLPDGLLSCLEALDAAGVKKLARQYLDGMTGALQQTPPDREAPPRRPPLRIVDKMPDNYLYIGILSVLFPGATFISVCRDLRDVALSCWMTNFRSVPWADDQENLAVRCRDYRRLMRHWKAGLPVRVHEVAYERLVVDFDTEAPGLLAACGLDWERSCGQFHRTARLVRTSSAVQVRQPLYGSAVQRWKRYERPLAGLFERLER
jgi:tetratricopeptide (TPR) repeat protein